MPDLSPPPPLILVVEGDEAKRSAIARIICQAGHPVTEAGTGREALRLARTGPSLVVLGDNLPDLGGVEVCRRLKADPATATLPILHVSAADLGRCAPGPDGAADAYLPDASDPAVVLAAIAALLRVRRAEEAARAAAATWQTTFDAISDGVFLLDRAGRVMRANAALAALLGRPVDELVGRPADDLHQKLPAAAVPFTECLATRKRARAELTLGDRIFRLTADPVLDPDGELTGAVGILADVTDRRRAEAARRATEEQFRALVESVRDYAIFRIDPDHRAQTWNEGVRRVLGFAEGEFVGLDTRRIFAPEDVAAGVPERELQYAAEHGSAANDRWMLKKDGTRFFAFGTTSAVRDEAGAVVGFTKVMRDMTAQKRAEEALQQADRRKDEFLAMLGHELRNPLAPIRNALFLMKLRGPREPGDVERLRAMMDRQITHIARLVDDLLDVSRITQGKFEIRTEAVDLREAVANAVEAIRPFLDERQLALDVSLPPGPVWVRADPVRLEQVFANLLHNAAKYTEPGGRVTVAAAVQDVRSKDGTPHAARRTPHSSVEVSVRDTGIGIRPELIDRIFDMFTQGDRVTGRLKEGLGLGLTLVKTLVEMHGGTVAATSAGPGQGSTFTVRLPVAADVAGRAEAGAPPGGPARPLRVLVVDDNKDAADSLQMVLETQGGHTVRVAYDGAAGVAAAQDFHPDVALLDIGLPKGLDGYEVARRIRAVPGLNRIPVVALTGYGGREDRLRSGEAGFTAHLVKPVDPRELRDLLARVNPAA
jgi:PAS domain S-box-containing protein